MGEVCILIGAVCSENIDNKVKRFSFIVMMMMMMRMRTRGLCPVIPGTDYSNFKGEAKFGKAGCVWTFTIKLCI